MNSLLRLKSARTLRISRSHVVAAAAVWGLTAASAFIVGRSTAADATDVVASVPAQGRFLANVPDDALLELLARVQAGAGGPTAEAEVLRYPELLGGSGSGVAVDASEEPFVGVPTRVAVAPPVRQVEAVGRLETRDGNWTLRVAVLASESEATTLRDALVEQELDAWLSMRRSGGAPQWLVLVNAFDARDEAEARRSDVARIASAFASVGDIEAVPMSGEAEADAG